MSILAAAVLLARFTAIEPNAGMDLAFEAGYRRHLEWHRSHKDPWTWHAWTILTGERLGLFVDATIDRTPEEIDAPVAPAEDSADNDRNVAPFGRFARSSLYRLRADLGSLPTSGINSPYATMATVRVAPGAKEAFESALKKNRVAAIVFELTSGGAAPSYLVVKPAQTFSSAVTWQPDFAHVDSVVVEALRYRPDLTYVP